MRPSSFLYFGITSLLAAAGLLTSPARAEEPTPRLLVETVAELRVPGTGSLEFIPAERVHIGDEILYTLRVRNAGDTAAQEPVIIKQVPRNTRYVAGSAAGPAAVVGFSADGGKTFGSPENVIVNLPDGTTRAASADDYTHIRWQLRHSLAVGATALLRFRSVLR